MMGFTFASKSCRRHSRTFSLETLETKQLFSGDIAACFATDFQPHEPRSALPTLTATAPQLGDEVNEEPADIPRFENALQLRNYLINAAVEQYGARFGQDVSSYGRWYEFNQGLPYFVEDPVVLRNTSSVSFATSMQVGDSAMDYSATNVQIDGVDEADLVESDGKYLYIMSGDELTIVDVQDASNMRIRSRLDLAGVRDSHFSYRFHDTDGMYLYQDRLTIVSQNFSTTLVTIVDIGDRSRPAIVENAHLDGYLASSRAVDDKLYLVLNQAHTLPALETVHEPVGPWMWQSASSQHLPLRWNPHSGGVERYETEVEFRARLVAMPIESLLPGMAIQSADGQANELVTRLAATDVYLPTASVFLGQTTSVVSFDVDDEQLGPTAMVSLPGVRTDEVFMTADNLYVFSAVSDYSPLDVVLAVPPIGTVRTSQIIFAPSIGNETRIAKFSVNQTTGKIAMVATGKVPGSLLNSFSVGEHEGHLQIATTTGWMDRNNIYVLGQSGNELSVTGKIEGIAPGEKIYSARFVGDRGFLVTFRKVDPLFTLDLSDPTTPEIVGELHIPGYSDYLQVIDENHIIGIGRNADESTGLFQELQISLFDVSDMSTPELVDRHSFAGGRNTQSAANFDSHAVGFFDSHDVLAIPIHSEHWWQGMFGDVDNTPIFEGQEQSSLPIFRIDVETGIESLGEIPFADRVQRSVRIGDVLFAISGQTVKAHAITDPAMQFGATDYRTAELDTWSFAPGALSVADVDSDGVISPLDALAFVNGLMAEQSGALGDLNDDGDVSPLDAEWVISRIGVRASQSNNQSAAATDLLMEDDFDIVSPIVEP